MKKVAIVNYGIGNLQSVYNAFAVIGNPARVVNSPNELNAADMIVLPGVGAFGESMKNLVSMGWIDVLEEEVKGKKKPFLGLCLGLQLLATTSFEQGVFKGLNWIPGTVRRLQSDDPTIKIPHIGWNDVQFRKKNSIYKNLGDSQTFYFVHSYIFIPKNKNMISGICNHGKDFAASIEVDNIFATQFHPEKSQIAGLTVIRNFLNINT